jgi:hypothetical protein
VGLHSTSDADSTTPPNPKLTYRVHHKLYRPWSSLHISTTASQEAPILLQLQALRAFLILKCSMILDAQALAHIKRHLTTFHANQPPQSCQGVDHAVTALSLPPDQRLASVLCYRDKHHHQPSSRQSPSISTSLRSEVRRLF